MKRSIILFGICGVTTFVIYYFLVFLFRDLFGFSVVLSVTSSYLISVSYHYGFNRKFTYEFEGGGHMANIVKYISMSTFSYFLQLGIILTMTDGFLISLSSAVISGTLVNACFTFFIMKFWVFK